MAECLFMINGLGMGNSTRCAAIIEALHAASVNVHVLTSGNGLTFFKDNSLISSLHGTESYFYSGKNGGVSGWRTLGSIAALGRIAVAKRASVEQLLHEIKPDVAVIDSEYTIGPLLKRGIPVIGLNNSEVIVSEYLGHRRNPRSIKNQFWIVEYLDYQFHKRFCQKVLSPSPRPLPPRSPKFVRIGMIVRSSVRAAAKHPSPRCFPLPRDVKSCVFMLSGSVFASVIDFGKLDLPYSVDVVGRTGPNTNNVTFHGRLMNNVELLVNADLLVVNGGFSAVSEAFYLDKPTFVIPVPGHAEQYVNARLVNELGHGFVADEHTIIGQLREFYQRNEWHGLPERQPLAGFDGAHEAAQAILSVIKR